MDLSADRGKLDWHFGAGAGGRRMCDGGTAAPREVNLVTRPAIMPEQRQWQGQLALVRGSSASASLKSEIDTDLTGDLQGDLQGEVESEGATGLRCIDGVSQLREMLGAATPLEHLEARQSSLRQPPPQHA